MDALKLPIAQYLFANLEQVLRSVSTAKAAAFIGYVIPLALAGLTVYWMVFGIQVARGAVQAPMQETVWRLFRQAFICSLLTGAGMYDSWVVAAFEGLREGLSAAATGGYPSPYVAMDEFGNKLMEESRKATTLAADSILLDVEHYWVAFLFSLCKIVLVMALGIPLYLSYGMFYLTLAIGPLAIACLLFPPTTKYFDSWLGALVTSMLTNVAASLIIGVALGVLLRLAASVGSDMVNLLSNAIDALIATAVLGYLGWKSSDLAAQWAGGSSFSNPFGLPGFAADQAGKAYTGAKGAVRWALAKVRRGNTVTSR